MAKIKIKACHICEKPTTKKFCQNCESSMLQPVKEIADRDPIAAAAAIYLAGRHTGFTHEEMLEIAREVEEEMASPDFNPEDYKF